MPTGCYFLGGSVLGGMLLTVGGSVATGAVATVEAFMPPDALWQSSAASVANVNLTNGLLTGVSQGASTIYINAGALSASTLVTVQRGLELSVALSSPTNGALF